MVSFLMLTISDVKDAKYDCSYCEILYGINCISLQCKHDESKHSKLNR